MLNILKLKLTTARQSSTKLVEVRAHIAGQNQFIFTKELTYKILSRARVGGWGWDGLNGSKAYLSPAKLKIADIGAGAELGNRYRRTISTTFYKSFTIIRAKITEYTDLSLDKP